jgi:maltose O-acetyltransferase
MLQKIIERIKHFCILLYSYFLFGKRVGMYGRIKVYNRKKIKIGNNCFINYGVLLSVREKLIIGDNVVISAKVIITDAGLDLNTLESEKEPDHVSAPITIENGAWIGAGAIILKGVTVGERSIVAAGAVVTKDVPPFTVVGGNPARVIKNLPVS